MKIFLKIAVLFLILFASAAAYSQDSGTYIYAAVHDSRNTDNELKHSGIYISKDFGNSWENIGWKSAKSFKVLPIESAKGQQLFAAAGNGVLRSTDSGESWKITTGWDITEVLDISTDTTNDSILYAATAYGICKTTDFGETWEYRNAGLKSTFVDAILVDMNNPDQLFACTDRGLYISLNRAESWSLWAFEGLSILAIEQDPIKNNIIYVSVAERGIFKSEDFGRTWNLISRGLEHSVIFDIAIDKINSSRIYAAAFKEGIYYSDNSGETWERSNLTDITVLSIDVHPFDRKVVVCGTQNQGVMISSDSGINWTNTVFSDAQIYGIKILRVR